MKESEDRIWLPNDLMGQRVRELREGRLGMTQAALGAALGYKGDPQGTIGSIELGRRGVPEGRLLALARLAGVSVTYFMAEGVVQPPDPTEAEELLSVVRAVVCGETPHGDSIRQLVSLGLRLASDAEMARLVELLETIPMDKVRSDPAAP